MEMFQHLNLGISLALLSSAEDLLIYLGYLKCCCVLVLLSKLQFALAETFSEMIQVVDEE